jgi:phosphoglucosamine mutase
VDCAHGAAYKSTPCVLRELGAEVIVYGNQPDGMNINKDCGSMHPEISAEGRRAQGAPRHRARRRRRPRPALRRKGQFD